MMCICCDKKISLLYPEIDLSDGKLEEDVVFNNKEKIQISDPDLHVHEEILIDAGTKMWNDGLVHKVSAGYGSSHDGDEFIIAICDDCIKKKKLTGNIAYVNNYMLYPLKGDEDYEKSRIAWRRYNRIDDILDDNEETQ
jgi:hypothetical protein